MFPLRLATLSVIAICAAGTAAIAQEDLAAGKAEYMNSCQPCHGSMGKGDGPMALLLKVEVSDLTQLKKNNNGDYPFLKVFQTIDGRAVVKAHGDGPMPIWGDRYSVTSGATGAEPYKSYTEEAFVRARILELTYYIQTLQE